MKIANLITFVILVIGGLNWLSLGIFGVDFVSIMTGSQTAILSRVIYIAVGISALWLIFSAIYSRGIRLVDDI